MYIKISGHVDASPMMTSPEEVQLAIENALKAAIPCQLYAMHIECVETTPPARADVTNNINLIP